MLTGPGGRRPPCSLLATRPHDWPDGDASEWSFHQQVGMGMVSPTKRSELHARFAAHFHSGEPPQTYPELALDALEEALDTILPLSYRQFIRQVGLVHTPAILDGIVARQLDHPDLNHLLSPDEVI